MITVESTHPSGSCPETGCPQPCGRCAARVYRQAKKITAYITYPDGSTAEARYKLTLDEAIELYVSDWTEPLDEEEYLCLQR